MQLDIADLDEVVMLNDIKQVTSAYIFDPDGSPSPDGIFSYTVFGRTGSEERRINFGYIDLRRKFFHPLVYNMILQMYRNLPLVIAGEKYVKLNGNGGIINSTENDPEGQTGIDFFINNWKSIKWNTNASDSRAKKESILDTLKESEIFISKWLVIPAMYRDINLHSKETGKIDMDEINAFYIKLINNTNSESITFTSSYNTQSSVQQTVVDIHDYLTKKIAGKRGVIRQAIMGKTVDYAVTSVISAPRFTSETFNNQQIPFNYIGVPLYQVCALFYPFIIKQLEDMFFDVEHSTHFTLNKGMDVVESSDIVYETVNTDSLKHLVSSFIKDKTKKVRTARFSLDGEAGGQFTNIEKQLGRPFTVTDLLYRAVIDVVANKHILSTRFPVTGSESLIINKIKILTTEDTIDLSGNDKSVFGSYMKTYPYFPVENGKIKESKIKWADTVIPNNAFLAGLGVTNQHPLSSN